MDEVNLPMQKKLYKSNLGFTLIELLVVIGILSILLAITLVAINPSRQFAQSNNTQRRSDVNAILNAIHQYGADNNGDLTGLGLGETTPTALSIQSDTGPANTVNFCSAVVPTYLAEMPVDPQSAGYTDCDTYTSDYDVSVEGNGRVTVSAPSAELSETIEVTR